MERFCGSRGCGYDPAGRAGHDSGPDVDFHAGCARWCSKRSGRCPSSDLAVLAWDDGDSGIGWRHDATIKHPIRTRDRIHGGPQWSEGHAGPFAADQWVHLRRWVERWRGNYSRRKNSALQPTGDQLHRQLPEFSCWRHRTCRLLRPWKRCMDSGTERPSHQACRSQQRLGRIGRGWQWRGGGYGEPCTAWHFRIGTSAARQSVSIGAKLLACAGRSFHTLGLQLAVWPAWGRRPANGRSKNRLEGWEFR